ncbi:BatA domain-containing protein [uncultured Mucilaginibacter sp.]|uniref:BatA domain-containing protein n=1 Tax=uncultured Mucilaginibacter sp. TaxID=797541 RepID=UPI0025DC5E1B|nr:BatA domain-containing protein [uncultured Mucilaginibacter sp.]
MFQFLNPVWFIGGAAVIIPVLIHLWNIRTGKVLKVGSITLIEAASRKSSRSFKLLDILLFILRCLLLVLLASLLASPVWQKRVQAAKAKGWVLIPRERLSETYQKFKPQIDSLTQAGYEFHYFNYGFGKSDLKQIFLHPKDSIKAQNSTIGNYWNLVKELDLKADTSLHICLFTPNQIKHFKGKKPNVALNLKWQTYIPADSVITWIHDAWFTPNGNIRVVQGKSTPSGNTFSFENVKANNGSNEFYIIQTTGGNASVKLNNSKLPATYINTKTLQVIIYTNNNKLDANYLKAALQAVSQFSQRNISIKIVSSEGAIPKNADWLFWLSDKPVGNVLAQNIFTYQSGKVTNINTWTSNAGAFATSLAEDDKTQLFRTITAANVKGIPVWQDGFGNPVLTTEQQGSKKLYRFYNRFNPAYNNLVWSSNFPAWMLQLMIDEKPLNPAYDKRTLSASQYRPHISTNQTASTTAKITETKSLSRYFWLALIIVFAAERWLAHYKPHPSVA